MSRYARRSLLCGVVIAVSVVLSSAWADRASARKLVEDARAALDRGDEAAASSLCDRAIAQDPDYRPAYELATPMWLQRRKYDVVIRHFERLTLRDSGYARGWYTLAYAYRLAGQTTSAIAAYELYIDMRPTRAEPHFGLAVSYKNAGRPDDARRAFARYIALERDPGRKAFVERAERELVSLGDAAEVRQPSARRAETSADAVAKRPERPRPVDKTASAAPAVIIDMNHPQLERAQQMIDDLRYSSAKAVLDRVRLPSAAAALERGRKLLLARSLVGRGLDRDAARLLAEIVADSGWWDLAIYRTIVRLMDFRLPRESGGPR